MERLEAVNNIPDSYEKIKEVDSWWDATINPKMQTLSPNTGMMDWISYSLSCLF